jgi:hypothetical protein
MATFRLLTRSHAEKSGKDCRNPKEFDGDLGSSWSERIASQPFFPREAGVSPLAPREQGSACFWLHLEGLFLMHINPLIAYKLNTFPSMLPPTPVAPEERLAPDDEWMQQNADLARLFGRAAIPLALLTQRAGATATDTGCIDHTQTAITFSAVFLDPKRLPGWTAQRPIRLERKIGSGEAASFPGGRRGRWSIP